MSSASHLRKILIVALILVVVGLAGVGSYLTFYRPTAPYIVTSMSSGTTPTSSTQTTKSETTSTTVVPTQWATVGQVKSTDYYLSLLESNVTQPYVQLARELRKIPGVTNATAVAKITYLALNATNPEVKEAFQLMIKGGTPDPRDFTYGVPRYNTELQVLYWLACQNEFKKDDTLALSISMVNGLWVTMGDYQVSQAVYNDTTQLLPYFRETNELQKQRGYDQLEDYPLEAKVALVWNANMAATAGHYSLTEFRDRRLNLKGYLWNTLSIDTLKKMQSLADQSGWFTHDAKRNVRNIEEFLFFRGANAHWDYTCTAEKEKMIDIEGVSVDNCGIFNVDWQFREYQRTGRFVGGCADESSVANAFLMSIGIASTMITVRWGPTGYTGHFHVAYYEPGKRVWAIYAGQLGIDMNAGSGKSPANVFYIFVPPVNLRAYTEWHSSYEQNLWIWKSKAWYMLFPTTIDQLNRMFSNGVPTSQMKQWLLYS